LCGEGILSCSISQPSPAVTVDATLHPQTARIIDNFILFQGKMETSILKSTQCRGAVFFSFHEFISTQVNVFLAFSYESLTHHVMLLRSSYIQSLLVKHVF
jgi:hypothetical protein